MYDNNTGILVLYMITILDGQYWNSSIVNEFSSICIADLLDQQYWNSSIVSQQYWFSSIWIADLLDQQYWKTSIVNSQYWNSSIVYDYNTGIPVSV